jgi:hypothetical protein
MKISKTMTGRFIEELRYVAKQMEETENLEEKLYYFSAVFGAAQRIINFEFDPEMLFIHQVTQLAYNQIQQRLVLIKSGQQTSVELPDNLFTVLREMVGELAARVENGEATYPILEKIMTLSYSTTGNGYYLFQKGELKI